MYHKKTADFISGGIALCRLFLKLCLMLYSGNGHRPRYTDDPQKQGTQTVPAVRHHGSDAGLRRCFSSCTPCCSPGTTGLESYTAALGIGKLITSVTMTLFYVLLYYVWRSRYRINGQRGLSMVVWLLALVRIALCLMPQNAWTDATPPLSWGIYRNIPFAILGALIVVLFFKSTRENQDRPFRHLWLTVVLSFACYIPVVLFADKIPAVGMLMIPKTCAYVWTVLIGINVMKKENLQ